MRMVSVLKPGKDYGHGYQITERDYIQVKAISMIGTFPVRDMVPVDQLGALQAFTNDLERRQRHAAVA